MKLANTVALMAVLAASVDANPNTLAPAADGNLDSL